MSGGIPEGDATPSHGRNLDLDGLRGIAVLLVTASHAGWPFLKLGAIAGVTLFFVLSGYLITTLLVEERRASGRVRLGSFYRRRVARLVPALVVMVVTMTLLNALHRPDREVLVGAAQALTYTMNLNEWTGLPTARFVHTWSLALEEQFYLLWPMILLATWSAGLRKQLWLVLAAVVASLVVRFAWYGWSSSEAYRSAYYLPISSMWAILIGVALALSLARNGDPSRRSPRWLFNAALLAILLTSSALGMTRGVVDSGLNYPERLFAGPLAAVAGAVLVHAAVHHRTPAWLSSRLLVWFGTISYALYLWHDPIIGLIEPSFPAGLFTHLIAGSVAAVIATAVAALSWRFVERPAGAWIRSRDRRTPVARSSLRQR